jgi:hypothetical protein
MPCSSHPPLLEHSDYTWRRVQVMKFLITGSCKCENHKLDAAIIISNLTHQNHNEVTLLWRWKVTTQHIKELFWF